MAKFMSTGGQNQTEESALVPVVPGRQAERGAVGVSDSIH
jgi:hypothetical protein